MSHIPSDHRNHQQKNQAKPSKPVTILEKNDMTKLNDFLLARVLLSSVCSLSAGTTYANALLRGYI